ncbi:MAG: right-handed parallel beta-helix repeat-containing protein [Desulfuromonadaceae bacterium]|nr:right-handed parallel beta-helix repeat-containing protein [Desulfuromonadaceae bacterium]
MKIFAHGILLILVLILADVALAADSESTKSRTIVWQGTVQIKKSYTVHKGKILEIRPGSRILFSKGTSLVVKGTLKAVGLKSEEIVFTSAKKGTTASWHEIMLDSAGDSVMEHCTIENATWGVHSHDTNLSLTACTIRNSEVGLRFRSGPLTISKCRFTGNKIGLRSYQGIAQIAESDFTDNEIGIFVREKGSGLDITRSNLFNNSNYNIRIGDFNNEDVKASGNWWGTENPSATICDARNEPDIGLVLFEPFSNERIPWQ